MFYKTSSPIGSAALKVVRPSFRPPIHPSVGPSITCFFPNARKRVFFSTFKIARGRGWRGEGIGSDERQWGGGREGGEEGDDEGDASDGRVSGLDLNRSLISVIFKKSIFWIAC